MAGLRPVARSRFSGPIAPPRCILTPPAHPLSSLHPRLTVQVSNFGKPVPTHLGLCDQRSVTLDQDALEYNFFVDGCVAYNYGLTASQAHHHRWFHFPRLAAHEAVVFKAYDSGHASQGATPSWVFHCAVDDPSCPPDAPERESMEIRVALAFPGPPTDELSTSREDIP